jgi:hypothetical protein
MLLNPFLFQVHMNQQFLHTIQLINFLVHYFLQKKSRFSKKFFNELSLPLDDGNGDGACLKLCARRTGV